MTDSFTIAIDLQDGCRFLVDFDDDMPPLPIPRCGPIPELAGS